MDDGLLHASGGRDGGSTLANVIVVSSRLSAPLRSALPEKSLELLTITLRTSSSSVAVVPSRGPRRRTSPVNHERNLGVVLVLRRFGSDVVSPAPTVVSRQEDSGDCCSGPPFPGIPDFHFVSLSVSILPVCCSAEVSRPDEGDGGRDGHLSARLRILPSQRARSTASRLLTALSRLL